MTTKHSLHPFVCITSNIFLFHKNYFFNRRTQFLKIHGGRGFCDDYIDCACSNHLQGFVMGFSCAKYCNSLKHFFSGILFLWVSSGSGRIWNTLEQTSYKC